MRVRFKVPVRKGAPDTREGKLFRLLVGGKPVRFVLQDNGALAHWGSGYVITQSGVGAAKLERMATLSQYTRTTDRLAAQIAVSQLAARMGADRLLNSIASVPVINTRVEPVSAGER
jgi:hypothetical protein